MQWRSRRCVGVIAEGGSLYGIDLLIVGLLGGGLLQGLSLGLTCLKEDALGEQRVPVVEDAERVLPGGPPCGKVIVITFSAWAQLMRPGAQACALRC